MLLAQKKYKRNGLVKVCINPTVPLMISAVYLSVSITRTWMN